MTEQISLHVVSPHCCRCVMKMSLIDQLAWNASLVSPNHQSSHIACYHCCFFFFLFMCHLTASALSLLGVIKGVIQKKRWGSIKSEKVHTRLNHMQDMQPGGRCLCSENESKPILYPVHTYINLHNLHTVHNPSKLILNQIFIFP